MAIYIKKVFQLTSMVFTIIVLLQMIMQHTLDSKMLYGMLGVSFAASLLKVILFKGILFEFSIGRQVAYLLIVWGLVLIFNFTFNWHMTIIDMLVNLIFVTVTYLCLRLISYHFVREDAKKMNQRLEDKRKSE